MRNRFARATARTAVLGASAALVATAAPAAFAQDAAPAAQGRTCVLKAGGGMDCGGGGRRIAAGPWAIKVHQHPNYGGESVTFYLPAGVSQCSGPFENEYPINIAHGDFWDNRISSVQSNDATNCNIKLYDGHELTANTRGSTGFADHCKRLSDPSTCVYYTAPKNKPFDNVTSSFIIS
ncbi:hypothetical protein E1293_45370 [Actinomadura darangshiensis]|uniref:Uncharacterized protein n=1 Tax=Actinomadura darangshiensis TaxID=705336 RepID=A0A4V6PE89_9ACTN|nr:hypothetical protein [Actinomadura darangshiensis]TDD60907.1 hypothetical protein E1293_45370 [Actinomadura darangshiensis]